MPGVLGRLAARVYEWELGRRNRRYDARRGVVEFDRPVISVGNLSVGGTGKTPVVLALVRELRESGGTPCIAMRGYAARGGMSDEAELYRRELGPGVPIVARPDRTQGLIELFATEEGERVDMIVLDDGFQHRRIARQADLVLIDASRSPFEDEPLPAGWLRERPEALRRAHAVLITHAEMAEPDELAALREQILKVNESLDVGVARHDWTGFRIWRPGDPIEVRSGGVAAARAEGPSGADVAGPAWLRDKRYVAACAIGNPDAFLRACTHAAGRAPDASLVLKDHDPFGPATVGQLAALVRDRAPDAVVVTEKDWVKLSRSMDGGGVRLEERRIFGSTPIVRPQLEMRFGDEGWLGRVVGQGRYRFGSLEGDGG